MKNIAGATIWLILVTACSSSGGHPSSSTERTVPGSTAPAGLSTTVRQPRLSARIDLRSASMAAGSNQTGYLVVENNTGASLRLTTGSTIACTPKWAVVLANRKLPQQAAFTKECGPKPLVIRAGETRLPFTLQATFQACTSTRQPEGALIPRCLPGRQGPTVAPPLPPDLYEATFFSDIAGLPLVASVPVRVGRHA